MPEIQKRPAKAAHAKTERKPHTDTNETAGYLSGFYVDFSEQLEKYVQLVHHFIHIQARVELAEKNLSNTREHFADAIARCKETAPQDWSLTLARARFVGARLSEACMALLREHRRLSQLAMLELLNTGQFRFRTPTPLREIHGALVKQAWVGREGDDYIWTGPDPQLQLTDLRSEFRADLMEGETSKKAS